MCTGAVDAERDAHHFAGVEVQEAGPLVVGLTTEFGGTIASHAMPPTRAARDSAITRPTGASCQPRRGWSTTPPFDTWPPIATPAHSTRRRPGVRQNRRALAPIATRVCSGSRRWGGDLDGADDAMEQVVGGDRGDLVADVDADRREVGDIQFEQETRPADGFPAGQVGVPGSASLEQGRRPAG